MECIGEAVGDAVLIVKGDGALNGVITDGVALCEVLGDDARSGFVLLREVVRVAGCVVGVGSGEVTDAGCAGDLNLGAAELGVV